MDEQAIKKTWAKLLIPMAVGLLILLTAILFHRLGSKRPGPQTLWMFVGVLGAIFILFPGVKALKFRRYLQKQSEADQH